MSKQESKKEQPSLDEKNFIEAQDLDAEKIAVIELYNIHIFNIYSLSCIKTLVHGIQNDVDDAIKNDRIVALVKTPENILISIGTQTIKYWNLETLAQEDCITFPDDFDWRPAAVTNNASKSFILLQDENIAGIFEKSKESKKCIFIFTSTFKNRNKLKDKTSYTSICSDFSGSHTNLNRADNSIFMVFNNQLWIYEENDKKYKLISIATTTLLNYGHLYLFPINTNVFLFFNTIPRIDSSFATQYVYNEKNNEYIKQDNFDPTKPQNLILPVNTFFVSTHNPQLNDDKTITFVLNYRPPFFLQNSKNIVFSGLVTLNLQTLTYQIKVGMKKTIFSFIQKPQITLLISADGSPSGYELSHILTTKQAHEIIMDHTPLPSPLVDIVLEYAEDYKFLASQKLIAARDCISKNILSFFENAEEDVDEDGDDAISTIRINVSSVSHYILSLKQQLITSGSQDELEQALITIAKNIRKQLNVKNNNKKPRPSLTILGQNSENIKESKSHEAILYQKIKNTLQQLNPGLNLEKLSDPEIESKDESTATLTFS